MVSVINMMHTQISRAIGSVISDRVIPEVQRVIGNLLLNQNGVATVTSSFDQGLAGNTKGPKPKLSKKDSRSAFDLIEDMDLTVYTGFKLFIQRSFVSNFDIFIRITKLQVILLALFAPVKKEKQLQLTFQ